MLGPSLHMKKKMRVPPPPPWTGLYVSRDLHLTRYISIQDNVIQAVLVGTIKSMTAILRSQGGQSCDTQLIISHFMKSFFY